MNQLEYAKTLREGAEKLLTSPTSQWWYASISSSDQVFNWLCKLSESEKPSHPLDFMTNNQAALCFLLLATALESGDL